MTNANPETQAAATPSNFLREIIAEDVRTKKVRRRRHPDPLSSRAQRLPAHRPRQGNLHRLRPRRRVRGKTNLRFDDTNPEKEEQEYVDSIMEDVRWLGFDWERLCYASDYFGQLYEWAIQLVKAGKAYVDDLSADEIRQHRGTLTEPGKDSPFRVRTIEENLDLFTRMKTGEFPTAREYSAPRST